MPGKVHCTKCILECRCTFLLDFHPLVWSESNMCSWKTNLHRYVTGHQNGAIRLWHMELDNQSKLDRRASHRISGSVDLRKAQAMALGSLNDMPCVTGGPPEYQLVLYKILTWHKEPVTALSLGNDLKQLCSGDAGGNLISWILPDDGFKQTPSLEIEVSFRIPLFIYFIHR